MSIQFIRVTNDVFDNNTIDDTYDEINIYKSEPDKIIFNEKFPPQIKKICLDCHGITSSVIGLFDEIEELSLTRFLPEIVDILKTNTKLKRFQCGYYDFINIDDLPKSINTLIEYDGNYLGCLNGITSVVSSILYNPKPHDLQILPNLTHLQSNVVLENNAFYENDKIELIRFTTKNNFKLKLPALKDLHLYINLNDYAIIDELNKSFVYLFQNCPNINKFYVTIYSKSKTNEYIILNTDINNFNLHILHECDCNISINGFKNDSYKQWIDNKWQTIKPRLTSKIIDTEGNN
jgi:hypothetical protein